jgi:hypothetical protein
MKEPPERSEPYAGFFVSIALSVHRRNLKIRDYVCLKIYDLGYSGNLAPNFFLICINNHSTSRQVSFLFYVYHLIISCFKAKMDIF